MGESTRSPGRRRVLSAAVAGTASLAGCSALRDQTGATDVVVHNLAADRTVVSITVTPEGPGEPHTSRTPHPNP